MSTESSTDVTSVAPSASGSSQLQSLSLGGAVASIASHIISAGVSVALTYPVARHIPGLLAAVGDATVHAAETGHWLPVAVRAGVAALASLLTLAVASKTGLRDLAGVITAARELTRTLKGDK
jgi:hypothetical protein